MDCKYKGGYGRAPTRLWRAGATGAGTSIVVSVSPKKRSFQNIELVTHTVHLTVTFFARHAGAHRSRLAHARTPTARERRKSGKPANIRRAQLEEKISVASRMMSIVKGVAECEPAQREGQARTRARGRAHQVAWNARKGWALRGSLSMSALAGCILNAGVPNPGALPKDPQRYGPLDKT